MVGEDLARGPPQAGASRSQRCCYLLVYRYNIYTFLNPSHDERTIYSENIVINLSDERSSGGTLGTPPVQADPVHGPPWGPDDGCMGSLSGILEWLHGSARYGAPVPPWKGDTELGQAGWIAVRGAPGIEGAAPPRMHDWPGTISGFRGSVCGRCCMNHPSITRWALPRGFE